MPTNSTSERGLSPERLRDDFERVMEIVGGVPTTTQYKRHGYHSLQTLISKFADTGRYYDAVETMGYANS